MVSVRCGALRQGQRCTEIPLRVFTLAQRMVFHWTPSKEGESPPPLTVGLQDSGNRRISTWLGQEGRPADGSLVLMPMLLSKPLGVSYH